MRDLYILVITTFVPKLLFQRRFPNIQRTINSAYNHIHRFTPRLHIRKIIFTILIYTHSKLSNDSLFSTIIHNSPLGGSSTNPEYSYSALRNASANLQSNKMCTAVWETILHTYPPVDLPINILWLKKVCAVTEKDFEIRTP